MPVTINTSNIFIDNGTSNYIVDMVRVKTKNKILKNNTPDISPSIDQKYSYNDTLYNYLNFTHDDLKYPNIGADATDLVVWWKFDNDVLFYNSAPNPINLVLTSRTNTSNDGNFTIDDKYIGNGSFYKSDQNDIRGYNITPENWLSSLLNLEATFTFWVKQTYSTSTGITQHIFRQDNSFIIRQSGTNFQVYISPDNWAYYDYTSGFHMPYYTWTHLAVVVNLKAGTDKQDVINVYKNGILLPTTLNTTSNTYSGIIGTGFNNDTSTFRFLSSAESNKNQGYRGYLDDFRIYKRALTGEEIYELYNRYRYTEYNVSFEDDTTCDILVVGGGGGGSRRMGGGGGAGALIYDTFTFRSKENYKLRIGKGGMGVHVGGNIGGSVSTAMKTGEQGGSSEILLNQTTLYKAVGGGGGTGGGVSGGQHAGEGGSGGGAGGKDYLYGGLISRDNIVNGGTVAVYAHFISSSYNPYYMSDKIFGNEGGRGNGDNPYGGGGGGGAGARGADSNSSNPNKNNVNKGGEGLSGVKNVDFMKHFSIKNKDIGHHYNGKVYFAGGGGGGNWNGYIYYNDGGLGGGGRSGMYYTLRLSNIDGKPNTGGGGGGDGYDQFQGGHGGSGVILLRYKLDYIGDEDYSAQWIHNKNNTSLHTYASVGIGTAGTEKYSLMINGDINFTGELYKDGGIIETPKHIVETPSVEEVPFTIFSGERLYPSEYARRNYFNKIDGVSPDVFNIYDSNNNYGNGEYTINYSTQYSGNNNSPHYIFHKPYPIDTDYSDNASWAAGQYSSGNYVGNYSLAGVKGDWITIQMPCKILLTKYIFVSIQYNNSYIDKLPRKYSIFGCNNNDNNWEKIYDENLPHDDSLFSHTYINTNDSYLKILTDNDRYSGNKLFNTFGLVVEKIGNTSVLAMAEWNIYGKEEVILNQKPIHNYFKQYPLVNSTSSAVLNNDYSRAIWNDNGYVIKARVSNNYSNSHGVYELFNGINNTYNDCYHSSDRFNGTYPHNYTSSTSFKGTSGDYIMLDVGRSINPVYMVLMPRSNTDYNDNGAFLNGCPGRFKVFASNDNDCYEDANHSSWIEIFHQGQHLYSNSYDYNTFTEFKFTNTTSVYRYYTLVTTHLSGNYKHLMLSDWRIFGGEYLNTDNKYLTFHYDPSGDFANNVTLNNYLDIDNISNGLFAWYKFDGNYNDSSGNDYHLTNFNTTFSSVITIDGNSVDFDIDNNNYLEFPSSINPYTISQNNGITFSFWFKLETNENSSFDDFVALMDFSDGSGIDDNRLFIALYNPDISNLNLRNLYFRINDTNTTIPVNKNTVDLSQYTLITWTIDSSGNWYIYINGILESSSVIKTIPNMTFSHRYINNNSHTNRFNGYLDNFLIYERPLTKSEIKLIYLKYINRNLIAHYDFNTEYLLDSIEREYPPAGKRDFAPSNNTDLQYTKYVSYTYGEGYYTITVSSVNSTYPQYNPIRTFNEADGIGGLWENSHYSNTTGTFLNSNFNNNNGKLTSLNYDGEWIQIELPVKIKLTKYIFKQRENSIDSLNAPGKYKIFGSNNERDWHQLVDKTITTANYSNWLYEDSSVSTTNYYKYFILVVNKLAGIGEYTNNLNFDEWYIYGTEKCKSYQNNIGNNYLIAKNNSKIKQVDGIIDKAIYITDDYDILSSVNNYPAITSTSTISYSVWVKRNRIGNTDFIFSQGVSTNSNEIGLLIDSNNKINFYVYGNDILTTNTYTDTSKYIHIVAIIDNNNISLYINGEFYSTNSVSTNIPEGILYIGSRGSNRTRLSIDEFRIYNRPLNSCDVYGLYKDLSQKYGQSQYELTFKDDMVCDILIVGGGGSAGGIETYIPVITDILEINSTSPHAFSYIAMPRGEETLLSYITHFGINHNSSNNNSSKWRSSYSGNINYVDSPIANNNYFTRYGRVRIIDGDGQNNSHDWAIFNFGIQNGGGDFDGKKNTSGYGYFGGESSYSGGTGGFSNVSKGHIWGYNTEKGWKLLYELALPGNSSHSHKNQYWWRSGGIVTSGLGKRQEYDNLKITHLGFSVSSTSYAGESENQFMVGGGGGAGDVLYYNNVNFSAGNYIINVGGGGDNEYINEVTNSENKSGYNGFNSSINGNGIKIISAGGGGGGGFIDSPALDGTLLSYINPLNQNVEYSSGGGGGNIQDYPKASGNNYSGDGGNNTLSSRVDDSVAIGGGGGGAGGMNNKGLYADAPDDTVIENRGLGGLGIINDITGAQFKYGYGGSGSGYSLNGQSGTGNGGHGGKVHLGSKLYGNGGSGIVIIKYKAKYTEPSYSLTQWTYEHGNDFVYHMGNVGIGTSNPTTMLDVTGDITGNTKNFKIEHPLLKDRWLYHGTIEAPRYENIYRGKKKLINGKCSVNIDSECNESGGMISGTFMALNKNIQLYLQNNQTFDKVIGEVVDGIIRIRCENTIDEIEIDWMVIGERKDGNVINEPITNPEGCLICEHYFTGYNDYNVDY